MFCVHFISLDYFDPKEQEILMVGGLRDKLPNLERYAYFRFGVDFTGGFKGFCFVL